MWTYIFNSRCKKSTPPLIWFFFCCADALRLCCHSLILTHGELSGRTGIQCFISVRWPPKNCRGQWMRWDDLILLELARWTWSCWNLRHTFMSPAAETFDRRKMQICEDSWVDFLSLRAIKRHLLNFLRICFSVWNVLLEFWRIW